MNFSVCACIDGDDCDQCSQILEELENIDDDCERHGIKFVKTNDLKIAEQYGATDFPVLMYFENAIGGVFEGNVIVSMVQSNIK